MILKLTKLFANSVCKVIKVKRVIQIHVSVFETVQNFLRQVMHMEFIY